MNQVNLHVPSGKIYGQLGRNGAGKTNIKRMLLNLANPTSDSILLFQEDYKKNPVKTYRRVGAVIETPSFYENLTGTENLEIIARLRGQHKKDTIPDVLKKVGLDKENRKLCRIILLV